MGEYALFVQLVGVGVVVFGCLLAVIMAFYTSWKWGLLAFLFFPLAPFVYIIRSRWALLPLAIVLLGVATVIAPLVIKEKIDLGPHIKMVQGPDGNEELRITLTGWDRDDYQALEEYPETAVLQMANEDVTDDTLKHLKGMAKLRVLGLSRTQITDEGVKVLAELPALEEIRLGNTKITDEGFRTHLMPIESLKKLDLENTGVLRKSALEWRKQKQGRAFSGLPKGKRPKKSN